MKIRLGINSLLAWVFILLFITATNALVYVSSLLNFKESAELIFVFSFYLFAYLGCLLVLFQAWFTLHKRLALKRLPGEKLLVTYEVSFDEYEKIKSYLTEIRAERALKD
jgi:uncharacterized membrane protein